jgi:hypothetical protein
LGDTFFEAKLLAITGALLLKSPGGGNVETVLTLAIQRLPDLLPRRGCAAGYQSGLSTSTLTTDELDRNTLILVSREFENFPACQNSNWQLEGRRR